MPWLIALRVVSLPATDEQDEERGDLGRRSAAHRRPRPAPGSRLLDLAAYGAQLAESRRAEPADDLTSEPGAGRGRRRGLTAAEIASFFILLVGGRQRDHPQRDQPRAPGPDRTPRSARAAGGRFRRPRRHRRRGDRALGLAGDPLPAHRDPGRRLGGKTFKAGDKVVLWYNSANRDEAVFADPYRFDLTRTPTSTSASASGPHFCLGAHLARREITVMFEDCFAASPISSVVGEPAPCAPPSSTASSGCPSLGRLGPLS